VEPNRLRFDFSHYMGMTSDELLEVERIVNEQIVANTELHTDIMDLDQALQTGAMALFGEKYGDKVRVVRVPGFSKELCGGTHVSRTGDIGVFKIIYEGSSASGVRRIEAITGAAALERFQQTSAVIGKAAQLLHASDENLLEHLEKTLEQQHLIQKQLDQLKTRLAQTQAGNLKGRELKGITVLAEKVDGLDRPQLRTLADSLRNKWSSAVIVLASVNDGDVSIVSAVSKSLTSKVQAGKLVGNVAKQIGGKGGGRPDMAEGAGKDAGALAGALETVYQDVAALL
jgi:alanyl-tRNA synthetase